MIINIEKYKLSDSNPDFIMAGMFGNYSGSIDRALKIKFYKTKQHKLKDIIYT